MPTYPEGLPAFAGNPMIPGKRESVTAQELCEAESAGTLSVLPLLEGKPLVASLAGGLTWRLAWQSFGACHTALVASFNALDAFLAQQSPESRLQSGEGFLDHDKLIYLGDRGGITYCALDISLPPHVVPVPPPGPDRAAQEGKWAQSLAKGWEAPASESKVAFIDLRLLMTGTDCSDLTAMGDLSIAGHARALVDWHTHFRFCGKCGSNTVPREGGKRRQCINDTCKRKLYPRLDPVVIMLIIDKENERVILGRQSRFAPRTWSCLAGFIEQGESLEEAVRRETREEVGIEVGEIVYHSSQPWPVGPSSMPYQLMVGFFAFATTFDIRVDKKELEEAKWCSKEQVRNALTFLEYKSQQQAAASRIQQTCMGDERKKPEPRMEAADLPAMFVPAPYAIAHHLIAAWALNGSNALLTNASPSSVL